MRFRTPWIINVRLKPILLFVTSAVFLVAMSGCGGDNKTSDILGTTPTAVPSSDTPVPIVTTTQSNDSAAATHNQNTFDSKGYDLACSDRVLGAAISDSIFHRDGIPSTDEIMKLEECRYGTQPSSTEPQNKSGDPLTTVHDNDRSKGQNKDGRGNERKNPQNQPGDPLTTVRDNDRSKGQNNEGGGNERSELANWRELYDISYIVPCIDERLGMSVTREFQTGKRGPTDEEMKLLEGCEIESARGPVVRKDNNENRGGSSQIDNWRELYDISYTVSCIDERLGTSVTREFQTGKRGPTEGEMKLLEGCGIQSDSGPVAQNTKDDMDVRERIELIKATSGGWTYTGNPVNDQYSVGYRPTADEWRCGVAAVGVDTLRDIRAGKHTITDEENQKLTPCFRASPKYITHPYAELWDGHCIPLDLLQEVIDYYRPSWEQLECHLEGLERYEMPNQIRYLMLETVFGIRNNKSFLYPELWDRIMTDPYYEDLELNFSPSQANIAMPPYYDWEYNDIKCHNSRTDEDGNLVLDDYWLDESLRGAVVGYIIEKKKGRRIFADVDRCSNAYVVQGDLADYKSLPINSVDDYKERALDIVIPGYILQAKAAEKVKGEMIQLGGIQAEVEVIFSMNEFLGTLPPSKQVELAQWLIDKLIPEVKKHFKGMIWVASAANYDSGDPNFPTTGMNPTFGPHWKNLSFAAADHVSFTLSLSCDFDHVERYLEIQFDNIQEIVQRDNVNWSSIGGTGKRAFGPSFNKNCKDDLEDKELEIQELMRSYIDGFPTEPYFLHIPQPPRSWTKEEEGYSPTASDASRGDWQHASLDENEVSELVREFWMDYARENVRD